MITGRVSPAPRKARISEEELRTARLLFDRELARGRLADADLHCPEVARAARVGRIPSVATRVAAQLRYKLRDAGVPGALDYRRAVLEPALSARASLLGGDARGQPRFLVRVDEFPHYRAFDAGDKRFGTRSFERFHETMAGAGVPYLLAVLPRVSREPLEPAQTGSRAIELEEAGLLGRLRVQGVTFALHGFDHRTRYASPRRHSELGGLDLWRTEELLQAGRRELAAHDVEPEVFVAPYNRFDARQLPLLARSFAVVCGGPESIGRVGFQATPQWRGEAVYLPAYAPFYGRAGGMLSAVEDLIGLGAAAWVPIVLHWEWEQERGFRDLQRLCTLLAHCACRWEDFLAAVARSRASAPRDGVPA